MSDQDPSELEIAAPRRGGLSSVSLIWLVPVLAIVISLGMAWKSWLDRGPLIEIEFAGADGVSEGQTPLKYRDVDVGMVEALTFSDDLTQVVASVRVNRDIAPFIDADAQFWLVQPQISAQGISGLGTLLGGVYIEGDWNNDRGTPVDRFRALSQPPLITGRKAGIEFTLTAAVGGTIAPGAPIIYKGVNVGLIERPVLAEDGSAVTAQAFVQAPYDKLLTDSSRFWGVSGVSVDFGTEGLKINIANVTALIQGGIEFDNIGQRGQPIDDGHVFNVFASRENIGTFGMAGLEGPEVEVVALFDTSIAGLLPGAPVQFEGLNIGSVNGTSGVVTGGVDGPPVLLRADISIVPSRLGIDGDEIEAETRTLLDQLVAAGYRARLTSQGLLGTTLKIDIVQVDDAPPAEVTLTAAGRPAIPVTAPALADVAATARAQLTRLDDVPIERMAESVADLLDNINRIVASNGVRAAPEELIGLVSDLRTLIGSEGVGGAVGSAQSALAGIAEIIAEVQEGSALDSLLAALARSDTIATAIDRSAAGLPDLLAQIQALAATAVALPLEDLIRAASGAAQAAETLVASDAVQGLPVGLAATLAEVEAAAADLRAVTGQVRESGAVDTLLAALARADTIAASLEAASSDVPQIVSDVRTLTANAAALPLGTLADQASALAAEALAVAGSEATQALPEQLSAVLATVGAAAEDARAITSRLAEGPAVDNLLAALQRTDRIAADVQTSAAGLPVLIDNLNALAANAAALPLDTLADQASTLVTQAAALAGSEATQALPAQLSLALEAVGAAAADARTITAQLADGPAVDSLVSALQRAESIAANVETTSAGLPELLSKINAVAAKAEALPLDTLVDASTDLVRTANALVGSDETAQIPAALSSALDQLGAALADLREGGAVANTNATLAAARDAADAIAEAARGLPVLAGELETLVARAETTLATYGDRSEFNSQTLAAIRDLRDTARAVTSLARTIERKPNALLIGR